MTFNAIGYANGPGGLKEIRTYNLTFNITSIYFKLILKKSYFLQKTFLIEGGLNYLQESVTLLSSETHGKFIKI